MVESPALDHCLNRQSCSICPRTLASRKTLVHIGNEGGDGECCGRKDR